MKSNTLVFMSALLSGVQALPQQCSGQSCVISYISGSSKSTYSMPTSAKLEGQNAKGQACIKEYLGKLNIPFPSQYAVSRVADAMTSPKLPEVQTETSMAGCKDKTILWVRGTAESGEFGSLFDIGKNINSKFSAAGWGTKGLRKEDGYDAKADNNYCVGLPGGYTCINWLNKQVADCPNTKFILGGYSQGAMVSRICIAFANDAAKKAVKGLLLLGDPMNGADNKGIDSSRIKTYCEPGDGVCEGKFKIGGAHFVYKNRVDAGLDWANKIINT